MQLVYSPMWKTALFLSVLFFLTWSVTAAQDIDIDLGGTSSADKHTASKDKPKTDNSGAVSTSASDSENLSHTESVGVSAKPKQKSKSEVSEISYPPSADANQVSFTGANLPEPKIKKISGQKLLIKMPKTSLKIPRKIAGNKGLILDIRSSTHPGNEAWIVLDVTQVKKWNVEKSENGFVLVLNPLENGSPKAMTNTLKKDEVSEQPSDNKSLFLRLIDLSLKPLDNSLKIVLTADGPSKYTIRKLSKPDKLVIRFQNTKLEVADKVKNFKETDFEAKIGGLLSIEMRQIGPSFSPISEAVLTLRAGTVSQIDRDLNQVIVNLSAPRNKELIVEKRGNLNQLVSLDIESAELSAVVKTLASEAGFDVDFVSPLVGVVNEKFKDIPLKTALATLLAPGGFDFEVQGNTLRIGLQAALVSSKAIMPHITEIISPAGGMAMSQFDTLVRAILNPSNAVKTTQDTLRNVLILNGTPSDIADYKRAIKDLKLDETNSDQITRIVKLNYAAPVSIQTILGPYLTSVGKVQVSGNNLVIWEQASNMGVLLELIKELDKKPAQVLIESNIVEIDSEKDLNIGINWSANKQTGDPTLSSAFNNPPTNAQGSPGSFTFGTIRSGLNINATLQALETHKKGKIISRPRIATASGVPAEINTTENVVIATTTSSVGLGGVVQTTTAFTELPLPIDLKVTPRITDDGRITTIVNASITSQTGPAQGAGAPPPTSVQTATTTITTKNGETIVIGGLVRETATDIINGIPLLSNLPIIGTLFQEHEKSNVKVELVIFITPTLLED